MVASIADRETVTSSQGIDPASRNAWYIAAVVIVAVMVLFGVLFWDSMSGAVQVWYYSATFNHAFLIIPIVAYLFWERRQLFTTVLPEPFYWGVVLHLGFGAVWLVANTASILEAQQFAVMGMIQATFLVVLGWRVYKTFLFPFLYLLFLVPTGEFLVPALQDFTAIFVVKALALIGVPVYHDGIFISIPNGNFEVAEACAGLRFLIAAIAFGFLFANLTFRTTKRRLMFIALAIIVPIIANGFRAFGIVMLAYLSDNRIAAGADHIVYGWGFFSFVLLLLIMLGLRMREEPQDEEEMQAPHLHPAGKRGFAVPLAGLLVMAFASVAPAYAMILGSLGQSGDVAALRGPSVGGEWQLVDVKTRWAPAFASADGTVHQIYERNGETVEIFIAYYQRQRSDAEVISHHNRLSGRGWERAGDIAASLTIDGAAHKVAGTRVADGLDKALIVHWNWIDGTFTASKLKSKLLQARGELVTARRAAAKVAILARYDDRPVEAVKRIDEFLKHVEPIGPMLADIAAEPSQQALRTEQR